MDLLAATLVPSPDTVSSQPQKNMSSTARIIIFVLTHLVSFFAVYLSWNCSTQQGLALIPKLAWALLAYCFGFIYILAFAFKHRDACAPLVYGGYAGM